MNTSFLLVSCRAKGTKILLCLLTLLTWAQVAVAQEDLPIRAVSDTILGKRHLAVSDPFDSVKVLRKLFPGALGADRYHKSGKIIDWSCPTCPVRSYPNAFMDEPQKFPYEDGTATRVLKVTETRDSLGVRYKFLFVNHSPYDEDGLQTGRFEGGLLGVAVFAFTDSAWELRLFQPAIAAYGSYSQCPDPELIADGTFLIRSVNGPAGGPFQEDDYVLQINGGRFKQVLAAYRMGMTKGIDWNSHWTGKCKILPGNGPHPDVQFTISGTVYAGDDDYLVPELKGFAKTGTHASFKIVRTYRYDHGTYAFGTMFVR